MRMGTKLRIVALAGVVLAAGTIGLYFYLAPGQTLSGGFTAEFLERPDGYQGLAKAYDLHFADAPRQLEPGLMYKACADGSVDVICGFATDGRIAAYDLRTLEDDKQFFPPYYAAPVLRAQTLGDHPELEALLNELGGTIDDAKMQELNYAVDRKDGGRTPQQVARSFLVEAGLIDADAQPRDGSAGTISVGGKDFTEQSVLGEIVATLIECRTKLEVERKLFLGGTMVCFNALRAGDLDLYVEYTGTGLVNILGRDVIADPDQAYQAVKDGFRQEHNLIWLKPLGFNNTYTLTIRKDLAEKLGVQTISDLARRLKEGA